MRLNRNLSPGQWAAGLAGDAVMSALPKGVTRLDRGEGGSVTAAANAELVPLLEQSTQRGHDYQAQMGQEYTAQTGGDFEKDFDAFDTTRSARAEVFESRFKASHVPPDPPPAEADRVNNLVGLQHRDQVVQRKLSMGMGMVDAGLISELPEKFQRRAFSDN